MKDTSKKTEMSLYKAGMYYGAISIYDFLAEG